MRRSFRTLLHIFSFLVVLTAVFAAGRPGSVAFAADRMYTFNMGLNGMQGNLILVESNGQWGLMDGGHRYADTIQDADGRTIPLPASEQYSSQISMRNGRDVAQYMVNVLGVRHLDFIVGTHSHMDHIGGIPETATTGFYDDGGNYRYLVDGNTTYFYKEYQHISDVEDDLERYSDLSWHNQAYYYQATKTMQDMGANLVDVSKQQVIQGDPGNAYGDYITFTMGDMSFRLYNLYEQTNTGGENVNSIVTVMTNGNYTVVNLSDIDTDNGAIDRTSEAIGKDFGAVDVVVAGHHGYEGSNTKIMFDELQPDFVVISNDRGQNSWLYTKNDLAVAMPYAKKLYGTNFYSTALSPYAVVTDMSGSKVYVYSINGKGNLTDIMKKMIKPTKGNGWVSWLNTDGVIWAYLEDGNTVKNEWREIKGKWYHFDRTGLMQTGWLKSGGNLYYLDPSTGARRGGWLEYDGQWYYLSKDGGDDYGRMMTGWQTVKGKRYYFYKDGSMASGIWVKGRYLTPDGPMYTGWLEQNGQWFYMNPDKNDDNWGKAKTGWQDIKKQRYYFYKDGSMASDTWVKGRYLTPDGPMYTGWREENGLWYYMNPDRGSDDWGRAMTGWQDIKKQRYYFYKDGHMAADVWVGGRYLTPDGPMKTGWFEQNGLWYYLDKNNDDGKYVTGWQDIKKKRYYFFKDGHMASNQWVKGHWLTEDGSMKTGWFEQDGLWYYLDRNNEDGKFLTGWQDIKKNRYYFYKDGHMARNEWVKGYYLTPDGPMGVGWQQIDGSWYYLRKDDDRGKPLKGWQTISKNKYFFYKDGRMASDAWVDGYYMTPQGPQGYGWQNTGGSWYYLDTNKKNKGYGKPLTGWQNLDGSWYFFYDDGRMAANTFVEGYFLNADGRIGSGWQTVGSDRYYIDAEGHALTGRQTIDGSSYDFGSDGRLVVPPQQTQAVAQQVSTQTSTQTNSSTQTAAAKSAAAGSTEQTAALAMSANQAQSGGSTVQRRMMMAAPVEDTGGWLVRDDGSRVSLDAEGQIRLGWLLFEENWYYLNDLEGVEPDSPLYGVPLTGTYEIDGQECTFDENGVLLTDKPEPKTLDEEADREGDAPVLMTMMRGAPEEKLDPPEEELNPPEEESDPPEEEPDPLKNGLVTGDDGNTYYYKDDVPTVDDWQQIDGAWYFFDSNGAMVTGWRNINGAWYYFDADGTMHTGWLTPENESDTFYLNADGVMQKGWQTVDGMVCYLDANGILQTGLRQVDGVWYFFNTDGALQTGWQDLEDGAGYYFDDGGALRAVRRTVSDVTLYQDKDGNNLNGWLTLDGGTFFVSDGVLQASCWLTLEEGTYYLDTNGSRLTGWQDLEDGARHCFSDAGVLQAVLRTVDDQPCYTNRDGAPLTGWLQLGDDWYYCDASGVALTGWQTVGDKQYFFDASGCMAANAWVDGLYLKADGQIASGWEQIDSSWYYFGDNGIPLTYWQEIDGLRYYLGDDGVMQTGWVEMEEGVWYYLFDDGHMASNQETPDGYYVDASGVWQQ